MNKITEVIDGFEVSVFDDGTTVINSEGRPERICLENRPIWSRKI